MDDDIKRRILALMAKTTENGCTEAEAIFASQKVQELLNKYQLSLSDLKIQETETRRGTYPTNVKAKPPVFWCLSSIGYFTDCRTWSQFDANGKSEFHFFGLDHDVMIAEYICKVIDYALIHTGDDYKDSLEYAMASPSRRSKILLDFRMAMAQRIGAKLRAMKDEQKRANASTGRDLVVVKSAIIDPEFNKLGMAIKTITNNYRTTSSDAFNAGRAAGDKFNLNSGIKGREPTRSVTNG